MAAIREELGVLLRQPLAPWIWALSSILALVTGPFGTYDSMSLPVRLIFWPCLIATALLSAYVLCAVFSVVLPKMNVWMQDTLVAVVFSVLFTPVVALALSISRSLSGATGPEDTAHFLEVLAISLSVSVLQRVAKINWPELEIRPAEWPDLPHGAALAHDRASARRAEDDVQPDGPPVPRLLRRLSNVRAAEVLRLTVEDHYVEVVLLGRPSQRILMRFADAVDEIEGLDGLFVHRSHWVVRAHILGSVAENGREMIEMIDGSRVPVSRTYRANLVARGVPCLERDPAAG